MIKKISRKIRRIFRKAEPSYDKFILDDKIGIRKRVYNSYVDYIHHQKEKLSKNYQALVQNDIEYEKLVFDRYKDRPGLNGKSLICLAARLGGEVRAFKRLGALAIGIDIEPGNYNPDVLFGDFHKLNFPDGVFDIAFTNAIDHVFDLDRFITEVKRILKEDGIFIIEFGEFAPGKYEVFDTSEIAPFISQIENHFHLISMEDIKNKTEYIDWKGKLMYFKNTQ
jgi:SAM-dependent methyltransferase